MSTVPVEEGKKGKGRPAYKGNPTATTQNVNLGAMEAPTNTKFRMTRRKRRRGMVRPSPMGLSRHPRSAYTRSVETCVN